MVKVPKDDHLIFVGEKLPKSVYLKIRVAPLMIKLIDAHVKANGIKSRSFFVRSALNHGLNISIGDLITCSTPFLKHQPEKRKSHE